MDSNAEIQERFARHLQAAGFKLTRQRAAILEEFLCQDEHVSAEELYTRIQERHPELGQATVFRTMRLIAGAGIAQEVRIDARTTRYEKISANAHHDHIQCVGCGAVFEFIDQRVEELQDQIAARFGVKLLRHRMDLYGLCADCQANEVKNDQH